MSPELRQEQQSDLAAIAEQQAASRQKLVAGERDRSKVQVKLSSRFVQANEVKRSNKLAGEFLYGFVVEDVHTDKGVFVIAAYDRRQDRELVLRVGSGALVPIYVVEDVGADEQSSDHTSQVGESAAVWDGVGDDMLTSDELVNLIKDPAARILLRRMVRLIEGL